ncbi:EamA family transporter [Jannaschia seohaensis]|uniref:EamA-like transporter family protein n=1 Tax=Jannaschia seohaensis TaxID=475081 RepID=A0A2Y9AFU0_9RHOB|nr:EamA family transporter [Jannaschia seohaensis]PWJ21019.1 EamA-like transporter family protein [Jannaschia seohaensis]SSA41429.1 EamA-like transporter family protein [Jannaschia seohaensis]
MDWLTSLEGTEAGHRAALILALTAAFLHAMFGALQKGRYDPWTSRTVMDVGILVLSAPFALFVVPWPPLELWWVLVGMVVIHFVYKALMAMTYDRGAYTVVYPVVRGTGPLFTVLAAGMIFGESFTAMQWGGVGLLLAGLFGLSAYNLAKITVAREKLGPALGLAVMTGLMVAVYTTWDAYGIRAVENPFTFLAWFFFLTSFDFPLIALARGRWRRPDRHMLRLGLVGALIAFGSFGSVMMATRLDDVGEAAVLRETSTVFAALIGWLWLREPVGPRRIVLMSLIALGAVVVEMGG